MILYVFLVIEILRPSPLRSLTSFSGIIRCFVVLDSIVNLLFRSHWLLESKRTEPALDFESTLFPRLLITKLIYLSYLLRFFWLIQNLNFLNQFESFGTDRNKKIPNIHIPIIVLPIKDSSYTNKGENILNL